MAGNLKTLGFLAVASLSLAGCCARCDDERSGAVYSGQARRVEYHLDEGKTVVFDDQDRPHEIEGFPALYRGKIHVDRARGGEEGYEVTLLESPATQQTAAPAASAAGQTNGAAAPAAQPSSNPYE
ncbi:MAG: hypothetical protein JO317_09380 [Verrucomicrobiae bacterium]|nr:hypothetical protein [Verrucomicrobiae bacterium]